MFLLLFFAINILLHSGDLVILLHWNLDVNTKPFFNLGVTHDSVVHTGVLLLWMEHGCCATIALLKRKIKHTPPHSCCFGAVGGDSVASWMCLIQTQWAIITTTFLCTPLTARMTHTTASHWWVNLHLYFLLIFWFYMHTLHNTV